VNLCACHVVVVMVDNGSLATLYFCYVLASAGALKTYRDLAGSSQNWKVLGPLYRLIHVHRHIPQSHKHFHKHVESKQAI
jgi:hypothetical protein